ncbi:unnamed protein product [Protopolystoma xenopodis]|uniref:Uncharacterized protein n=1 Tax=Protopolystoma xenopodis TaxID=117903 RepID=A0A448WHL5_9PLAT|nr:unnamed protein product [Protopolystoma xenopodis]
MEFLGSRLQPDKFFRKYEVKGVALGVVAGSFRCIQVGCPRFTTWSCCQGDLVGRSLYKVVCHSSYHNPQHQTVELVHSQTFRQHQQSVLPFYAPSYEPVTETSDVNPSTNVVPKPDTLSLLFPSWPIYLLLTLLSHCRPITTSHLLHFFQCGLITPTIHPDPSSPDGIIRHDPPIRICLLLP